MSPSTGRPNRIQRHVPLGEALLLALVLCLPGGACAADLHGKVVGVADGDTVTVLDQASQRAANTLNQLLDKWSKEPIGDRTVEVLMDGVYSNGRSVDESTPYFSDMMRYMRIRSYGRPTGEHWGKITMLETMGVIIKEAQQYRYLESILPQWRRSLPAGHRVELRLNDSSPYVLQQGNGARSPVLRFQFVDSAVTLIAKEFFGDRL